MRRVIKLVGLAAVVLAVGAAPAYAHVTVSAPGATQGGEAVLTFRVPTESETLSTTGLKVQLPTATPIASVSVQPIPGWTIKTTKTKLSKPIQTDDGEVTEAVSEIDWTANSAESAIKPGQFGQFAISVGPLPAVATLTFKAIQIYSDNSQVAWIEQAAPGSSAEPEHPAPTLSLAKASAADGTGSPMASDKGPGSNTGAVVLSIVALVMAAAALGVASVGRGRRTGS